MYVCSLYAVQLYDDSCNCLIELWTDSVLWYIWWDYVMILCLYTIKKQNKKIKIINKSCQKPEMHLHTHVHICRLKQKYVHMYVNRMCCAE